MWLERVDTHQRSDAFPRDANAAQDRGQDGDHLSRGEEQWPRPSEPAAYQAAQPRLDQTGRGPEQEAEREPAEYPEPEAAPDQDG
jgi:hypothetical protein